jgi:hypothetical protein
MEITEQGLSGLTGLFSFPFPFLFFFFFFSLHPAAILLLHMIIRRHLASPCRRLGVRKVVEHSTSL